MPKCLIRLKMVAYDKEGHFYGSLVMAAKTYQEIEEEYLGYVRLLAEGKFSNVSRLDLVGARRVLFVFSSLRHVVRQNDSLTLNLFDYE